MAVFLPYSRGMGPTLRNLHVPLADSLYRELRAAAVQSKRPATELARQAIDEWLERSRRATLRSEIRAYAERHAGSEADVDLDLEAASVEHLRVRRRRRP